MELNDGTLLVSTRVSGNRYNSRSTDGGKTWTLSQWDDLVGPACNGDMIYFTSINDGYEKNRILRSEERRVGKEC